MRGDIGSLVFKHFFSLAVPVPVRETQEAMRK